MLEIHVFLLRAEVLGIRPILRAICVVLVKFVLGNTAKLRCYQMIFDSLSLRRFWSLLLRCRELLAKGTATSSTIARIVALCVRKIFLIPCELS